MLAFVRQYRHYLILLLLFAASVGAMNAIIQRNAHALEKQMALVAHSNTVITRNQELSLLIERMLASRRGYALSGDTSLAVRYETSKAAASNLLAELSALINDNSAQSSRLTELQHHFLDLSEKLDALDYAHPAPAKSRARLQAAEALEATNGARDDLLRVGQSVLAAEQELLARRTDAMMSQREYNHSSVMAAAVLFSLLLLGFNGWVFYGQFLKNRKEQAAAATQEIFRLAAEGASDGIFEWNFARDKAFYSNQFWSMLGYAPERFPDTMQSFKDLLHPDERERVLSHVEKYMGGEVSEYLAVFRMKHQSGRWIWINARGRALYDENGKAVRLVGAHTDISHIKAYEDKLRKAKEHAEKASRAKTDFLAHMSHEIRTPLTAISGIAEIFEKSPAGFDPKQRQLIKVLSSSTSSLKDLVSDILDFSKIESGELELEEKVFSLQDVFDQVISIVSLRVGEKSLDFTFDCEAVRKQKFLGDRARLRQILINLIGNAVKFTDKGSVAVTATQVQHENGPLLRIDVKDTGVGIDPQNFDLIFERFKQADSSVSRKYGGTGLGLPISLRLARLMGGDITLESAPGKGSVFTLVVPFRTQETLGEADGEKPGRDIASDIRRHALNRKNILLVEDYEGNIVILTYLLESLQCPYDVARTGLEALNMWKQKRYDLILMDVQMPEMDGFTATAQIRRMEKEKEMPRTPIIGMTAHALVGDREKCIEAGMDTYLPKPIVEADLKAMIIEYLSRKKAA